MLCKSVGMNSMSFNDQVEIHRLKTLYISRSKTKTANQTSALIAGFGMVALVEFQLNPDTKVPEVLVISFVLCTCLLVAVNMIALMLSTFIFPYIQTIHNKSINPEDEEAWKKKGIVDKLHCFIETSWFLSNVVGVCLFLGDVTLICWIKYYDLKYGKIIGIIATGITVPVIVMLILLAIIFHRKLISHHYKAASSNIQELEKEFERIRNFS